MIKMYSTRDHDGDSPEFWEENWLEGHFEQSLQFCALDPLRPLFEKYSEKGSLLLEGGCGLGQYVVYYDWRGRRVVGLDFARRALATLRRRQPSLRLAVGDVASLPFPEGIFDLYYSGGVVEHFEHGASDSLVEARRVLKRDGVLLVSVPYCSPLRRLLLPFKRDEWRWVDRAEVDRDDERGGRRFFQYVYDPSEFEQMVRDSGLRVVEKQGYAVLWGIKEIPLLNGGRSRDVVPRRNETAPEATATVDDEAWTANLPRSMLKRLVVSEDAGVPLLGLGVRFVRWFAANMMMYVCVRDDSPRDA